eukprot:SAG11_NODE_362_length_10182_cov_9.886641_6_plen_113_part_00
MLTGYWNILSHIRRPGTIDTIGLSIGYYYGPDAKLHDRGTLLPLLGCHAKRSRCRGTDDPRHQCWPNYLRSTSIVLENGIPLETMSDRDTRFALATSRNLVMCLIIRPQDLI